MCVRSLGQHKLGHNPLSPFLGSSVHPVTVTRESRLGAAAVHQAPAPASQSFKPLLHSRTGAQLLLLASPAPGLPQASIRARHAAPTADGRHSRTRTQASAAVCQAPAGSGHSPQPVRASRIRLTGTVALASLRALFVPGVFPKCRAW